ncbi:MAG: T9SS type A sorting domain-containing protein [Bacteroidota bacterium]
MKRRSYLHAVFFICTLLLSLGSIQATHFNGLTMRYECLPNSSCQYRFYHTAYYDCSGAGAPAFPGNPPIPNVIFRANTPGVCTNPTIIGSWILVRYTEITPSCPFITTRCTNPLSPINGVVEATYYADYNFCNVNCSSYTAFYGVCCRNGSILSGGANAGMYIDLDINLGVSPCNSSPVFVNDPAMYICAATSLELSQLAFDPDGDSLSYSLVACKSGASTNVSYNTGFSPQQPMGPNWNVALDSVLGILRIDPIGNSALVFSTLCIEVEEYRNGQLIGSVTRDMHITVVTCPTANSNPEFNMGSVTTTARQTSPNSFRVCLGDTFEMSIRATDRDPFDTISLSSFVTQNFPGATFIQTGTNPAVAQVSWVANKQGIFGFNILANDSNCVVNGLSSVPFLVQVDTFCVSASITDAACGSAAGAIDLTANWGTPPYTFAWSNGATTEDITGLLPGFYSVSITDANGTVLVDSFLVNSTSLNLNASISQPDCRTKLGGITLSPTGGIAPYSYSWTNGSTTASVTNLPAGGYTVYASDAAGCLRKQVFILDPPDSCFNLIRGKVYVDQNQNCVQDMGDAPLAFSFVDLTPGGGTFTDANGEYTMRADTGNFLVESLTPSFYTGICPATKTYTVRFDSLKADSNKTDFALDFIPVQDLDVDVWYTILRPGRTSVFYARYQNLGNQPISGTVTLKHDTSLTYSPVLSTISYNAVTRTASKSFSNLNPGQFGFMTLFMEVDSNRVAGDSVEFVGKVFPIMGDATPQNNVDSSFAIVLSSFDPNDKQVSPQGIGSLGLIEPTENQMDYTIRFMNTGNDTAFYVVIRDTLDTDLDVTSIQLKGASHPFRAEVEDDKVLVFTFENILLPDSATNFTESQGFVAYSINHKGTLPVGTEITNSAAIYFDFNKPIITNTVLNTIFTYPQVALSQLTDICVGDSIIAQLTQAGMPPYLFGWSDGTQDPNNQSGTSYLAPTASGTYSVQVTDAYGFTTTDQVQLTVNPQPDASFAQKGSGLTRTFTLNATTNTTWTWDLGDGTVVTDQASVTHTYAEGGEYQITVIAENDCGIDNATIRLGIYSVDIQDTFDPSEISLRPNPFSSSAFLEFSNPDNKPYELRILDLSGKEVQHYPTQTGNRFEILRGELASGMYFYQLTGERQAVGKLWVE